MLFQDYTQDSGEFARVPADKNDFFFVDPKAFY